MDEVLKTLIEAKRVVDAQAGKAALSFHQNASDDEHGRIEVDTHHFGDQYRRCCGTSRLLAEAIAIACTLAPQATE